MSAFLKKIPQILKLTMFLTVGVSALSLPTYAEMRFLGRFDAQGNRYLVNTKQPYPSDMIKISAGHTVTEWPEWPVRTSTRFAMGRFHPSKTAKFLKKADERFYDALEEVQDAGLISTIKYVARKFSVDPAVLLGSVLGELTFNNKYEVKAQDLAGAATPSFLNFKGAKRVASYFNDPALKYCQPERSDYWSWVCINQVWSTSIIKASNNGGAEHVPESSVLDISRRSDPLHGVLRPRTGGSYGIAQMSLARALMVSGDVAASSNYVHLGIDDMGEIMNMVLNNEASIYILGASAARCVDVYKRFAGFDISENIGVQVTLFNLGYEFEKAEALKELNDRRVAKGLQKVSPKENYMGWYINEREAQIRAALK